jgi:hypothetical protein
MVMSAAAAQTKTDYADPQSCFFIHSYFSLSKNPLEEDRIYQEKKGECFAPVFFTNSKQFIPGMV